MDKNKLDKYNQYMIEIGELEDRLNKINKILKHDNVPDIELAALKERQAIMEKLDAKRLELAYFVSGTSSLEELNASIRQGIYATAVASLGKFKYIADEQEGTANIHILNSDYQHIITHYPIYLAQNDDAKKVAADYISALNSSSMDEIVSQNIATYIKTNSEKIDFGGMFTNLVKALSKANGFAGFKQDIKERSDNAEFTLQQLQIDLHRTKAIVTGYSGEYDTFNACVEEARRTLKTLNKTLKR